MSRPSRSSAAGFLYLFGALVVGARADEAPGYLVCVSNEKSGSVTLFRGMGPAETIPVGKRPRGIHASPDGRFLYVALSGSPIGGPPQLDARGNPIFKVDDDGEDDADHSADGIGVVDLRQGKFLRKLPAGSDPEEFAVSPDGKTIYVSNEDVGTASILDVGGGKVIGLVKVRKEPEGVAIAPDGRSVYVTCE